MIRKLLKKEETKTETKMLKPRIAPKVSAEDVGPIIRDKPVHDDLDSLGLITDPQQIEKESKRLSERRGNKLWMVNFTVPEKQTSLIWVRQFLGVIFLHNIPVKTPSGKVMSEKRICSSPDSVRGDCAYCDAAYKASKYYVYEIVNITGRKNKDGEQLRNLANLYIMNETRHEIFEKTAKKGLSRGISSKMIEVQVIGSGTQSTHLYTIVDKEIPSSVKQVERLNVKEFLTAEDRETQEICVNESEHLRTKKGDTQKKGSAAKSYSDLDDLFD